MTLASKLKKRITDPVLNQLKQGADPVGLARSCAAGVILALFPLLGTTTLLCAVVGFKFKLNQPVLQAINYLLYPVQILLMPAYMFLGAKLVGAEPISFNPALAAAELSKDYAAFFKHYGMAGLLGVLVWAMVAPILFFAVQKISLILFKIWKPISS